MIRLQQSKSLIWAEIVGGGGVPAFLLTLALTRLLYEAFFPATWLGQPLFVLPLALLGGVGGGVLYGQWAKKWGRGVALLPFLPLWGNLFYLFEPTVNLVASRFFFAASLWLALLLTWQVAVGQSKSFYPFLVTLWLGIVPIYLLTMGQTVGRADTFEFQVVTAKLGIVHPTGYPLYLLLGRGLTALIPIGEFAWKLNLVTMVYGVGALSGLFWLGRRLTGQAVPAVLAALLFGLTPTFWGQAIEAEIYTLHGLLLVFILGVVIFLLTTAQPQNWHFYLLFLGLGLGLTNHLTTMIMMPAVGITLILCRHKLLRNGQFWLKLILAFLLPLLLYAYLPLRWQAVNGDAMGWERFWDWVVAGRFRGALQLMAWWRDPTRYAVVGRLLLNEWGWLNLLVAMLGFVWLVWHNRQVSLILLVSWLGFIFYALNYYVPDLAQFMMPAQLLIAVVWGVALAIPICQHLFCRLAIPLFFILWAVAAVPERWQQLDRSAEDGLTQWGRTVLALPLEEGAAILVDSEKIAPLYYLQQTEGLRTDLDILVLPDEATYRAELYQRLANGQAVYLGRFLPHLAGSYHLSSLGALLQVSRQGTTDMPASATPADLIFDPLQLIGYEWQLPSPYNSREAAITLYWRALAPPTRSDFLYLRWANANQQTEAVPATGQLPADNYYPTVAWRPGELVADFHALPLPVLAQPTRYELQLAVAAAFTPAAELAWQTVTELVLPATEVEKVPAHPLRASLTTLHLMGIQLPSQIRPQTPLPITLLGIAETNQPIPLQLTAVQTSQSQNLAPVQPFPMITGTPFAFQTEWQANLPNGSYELFAHQPEQSALCGWMRPMTSGCWVGQIKVFGLPIPPTATNFADQIALLSARIPDVPLQPGGQLSIQLQWQALAPINEDYTLFIQLLNAQDQIMGQIDSYPLHGTYPTSQWQVGEQIADPYSLQLPADLPAGEYRLIIGWYLLATLQRLSVVDHAGTPLADHFTLNITNEK